MQHNRLLISFVLISNLGPVSGQRVISAVAKKVAISKALPNELVLSEDGQLCQVQSVKVPSCATFRPNPEIRQSSTGVVAVLLDASIFLPTLNPSSQAIKASSLKFVENLPSEAPVAMYSFDAGTGAFNIIRDVTGTSKEFPTLKQASPKELENALTVFGKQPKRPHDVIEIHTGGVVLFRLNAIEAIANHVANLPGRKALIWVCGDGPFDVMPPKTSSAYYPWLTAMSALERANMSIYPVPCTVTGIADPTLRNFSSSGMPLAEESGPSQSQLSDQKTIKSPIDLARGLANITGGRPYGDPNKLSQIVRAALEDNRCAYQLKWSPPPAESESQIHRLSLTANGVDLLYRQYHYAPTFATDLTTRLIATERALEIPLSANGIPIRIAYSHDAGAKTQVTVYLDPRQVVFVDDADANRDALLDVIYAVYDSSNVRLKQGKRSEIKLHILPQEWATFISSEPAIQQIIDVPNSAETMRVVIRDSQNGNIGSSTIRLQHK